jgi:hypothetical protein
MKNQTASNQHATGKTIVRGVGKATCLLTNAGLLLLKVAGVALYMISRLTGMAGLLLMCEYRLAAREFREVFENRVI